MEKKIEIKNMGLVELTDKELYENNGGGFLAGALAVGIKIVVGVGVATGAALAVVGVGLLAYAAYKYFSG
ncbi:MAG: hypothetical protein ACEPOZ_14220 [Marinifilaceae bacterium]